MENNQLSSSNELNDSNKDKLIELKAERWLLDLILVGVWKGENELGAFVVPMEVWKDESQILEIVNTVMLNTGYNTVRWL
jgi:hypothetical protein